MDGFWIAAIVVWISGLVFAWRVIALRTHRTGGEPEGILRQRLAAGAITPEEYERLLAVLVRTAPPAPERTGASTSRLFEIRRPAELAARVALGAVSALLGWTALVVAANGSYYDVGITLIVTLVLLAAAGLAGARALNIKIRFGGGSGRDAGSPNTAP